MYKITNTVLGEKVSYEYQYNAALLVGVPRSLNRQMLSINQEQLPFYGVDIWNAYEISWLNPKGKPCIATAKIYVDINSENIIESKSFKLYLNSFNQTIFSDSQAVQEIMEKDLSGIAKGKVTVKLNPYELGEIINYSADSNCFSLDKEDIQIDTYTLTPEYLEKSTLEETVRETLYSDLLKSNCLVTGQPDWASVFITYEGNQIDRGKLLQYLISFRQHNEFHEQCIERMYMDIMHYCKPDELTVYARYTRRGGLDINPLRSSVENPEINNMRLIRQ